MRREPLRIEPYLTRDYINRAVKMREIEGRLSRERKWRGWRLAAVWAVMVGASLSVWVAVLWHAVQP